MVRYVQLFPSGLNVTWFKRKVNEVKFDRAWLSRHAWRNWRSIQFGYVRQSSNFDDTFVTWLYTFNEFRQCAFITLKNHNSLTYPLMFDRKLQGKYCICDAKTWKYFVIRRMYVETTSMGESVTLISSVCVDVHMQCCIHSGVFLSQESILGVRTGRGVLDMPDWLAMAVNLKKKKNWAG